MTPAHLTLAAVAALAAAGKLKKRGSRSLKPTPPGYHVSSFWAVKRFNLAEDLIDGEWYSEDDEEWEPGEYDTPPDPEYRLYHVTTAADRVLSQRIKSRKQLQEQSGFRRGVGLGGGSGDQAPDLVSATVTLESAERIHAALVTAVRAARGELAPHEVALSWLRWSGYPDGHYWSEMKNTEYDEYNILMEECPEFEHVNGWESVSEVLFEVLMHDMSPGFSELPDTAAGWRRFIEKNRREIDSKWGYEDGAYHLIVQIEDALGFSNWRYDEIFCKPIVGFTEPASSMARMNPEQIKILALATKAEAVEVVPRECEARFNPRDLIVLGVVNPRRTS